MGFDKHKRPTILPDTGRLSGVQISTAATAAASTVFAPGVWGLRTTSTATPVVYTMRPVKGGEYLAVQALAVQSSSMSPYHINAGPTTDTMWDGASQMLTLATQGSGIVAYAVSSSQWMIVGQTGTIALTTST